MPQPPESSVSRPADAPPAILPTGGSGPSATPEDPAPSASPWAPDRRDRLLLVGLFGLALVWRLGVTLQLADLPSFERPLVDAWEYDRQAREIAAGRWQPAEPFFQSPLYPYLLGPIYASVDAGRDVARLLQALLGSLTVVLMALAGGRLGGRTVALLTGLAAVLYGPLVFHTPLLLKPTVVAFLEAGLVLVLLPVALDGRATARRAAIAGGCLGLLFLLRGNTALLVPAIAGWWIWRWRHSLRTVARPLAALAITFVACLVPVTWLNYRTGQELVVSTWNSGANALVGNRRGASGTYQSFAAGAQQVPEMERRAALQMAAAILSREQGRAVAETEVGPAAASRALWREARREVAADPGAWAALTGRKLLLFWNDYESTDAEDYGLYREHSGWLRAAAVDFGWIAPLGLLGLVLGWRRPWGPLTAALVAATCLSVVPFFVLGRYRLPVVPFLLPVAAWGVVQLLGPHRRSRRAWALLVVAAVVVHWPVTTRAQQRASAAISAYNLGVAGLELARDPLRAAEAEGWLERAEIHLHRALAGREPASVALRPLVEVLVELGDRRRRSGNEAAARERYRKAAMWLARLRDTDPTASLGTLEAALEQRLGRPGPGPGP